MRTDGLLAGLAAIVVCAGIGVVVWNSNNSGGSYSKRDDGLTIWTDAKTGCRYIREPRQMSPLMRADGTVNCGGPL